MDRSITHLATVLGTGALALLLAQGCDTMSPLAGAPLPPQALSGTGGGGDDGGGSGDDGGTSGDDGGGDDGGSGGDDGGGPSSSTCAYTDDKSFCACNGWTCGGITIADKAGVNESVYCGSCPNTQYCQPGSQGVGVGTCGGSNPLQYEFQKQKIDILVSMGENDNTTINYSFAKNIGDGRGYTVGKVGFCTGTGDFITVAACYNDLKPGNILSKYWGHRDSTGKATDGLIYYNDAYVASGMNQGETKLIDSLGSFVADVATAAGESDGIFRKCQDAMADAFYLAASAQHATERGLKGALTIGFLYDTELNFGDDDDPKGTVGTKTVMARADADYGATLPKDFTGKPWEESKWLGYLIKERVLVMDADKTWQSDIDQNSTWEAARRLQTASSNATETKTNLDMDYEFASKYKAGFAGSGAPCWTGLKNGLDSQATVYLLTTDKKASATDETKWTATATKSSGYAACPANPTP